MSIEAVCYWIRLVQSAQDSTTSEGIPWDRLPRGTWVPVQRLYRPEDVVEVEVMAEFPE
jgi:hypothetical protein